MNEKLPMTPAELTAAQLSIDRARRSWSTRRVRVELAERLLVEVERLRAREVELEHAMRNDTSTDEYSQEQALRAVGIDPFEPCPCGCDGPFDMPAEGG